MLQPIQKDTLASFIGDDGCFSLVIREFSGISAQLKVVFLRRSVSELCLNFLQSLDRLYDETNLELVRAYKLINDLCFNNDVKYGDNGVRAAISHWFGGLYSNRHIDNIDDYRPQITWHVERLIQSIESTMSVSCHSVRQCNPVFNESRVLNSGWRLSLDLPSDQLLESQRVSTLSVVSSSHFFMTLSSPSVSSSVMMDQYRFSLQQEDRLFIMANLLRLSPRHSSVLAFLTQHPNGVTVLQMVIQPEQYNSNDDALVQDSNSSFTL